MIPERVDVLVIGGGPAGLYAARELAHDGHDVLVCEEHPAIGEPVHCTGVLAVETFTEFGLTRDSIVNELSTVRFCSPGGQRISYTTRRVEAVVIDRAVFDRGLAASARAAGARVLTSTRVTGLDITSRGARARAGSLDVRARLVVLACGAKYTFHRALRVGLPSAHLHTAQRELPIGRAGDVEVHFGGTIAPGGFAWAVPVHRASGPCARIGVMAQRSAPACYRAIVDRLSESWRITEAAPPRLKILPLGPIQRTVAGRVIVIGDAAGIVKPTTGGGIYYSLASAALAAETASAALRRDRLDERALVEYEDRWRARLDEEIASQAELRRIAERMSDAEIETLFDLARTDGIMPIVRKTARFNHHRQFIRTLLHHPPARRVLFRALAG